DTASPTHHLTRPTEPGCFLFSDSPQETSAAYLTQTVFGSVKNRSASSPPSRPTPLCFTPPNGVRRSRSSQQFTHTVPVSSRSAIRCARPRSRVHSDAHSPKLVPLA